MIPSNYAPSDVLNAPSLLYVGNGQLLTPYFVQVASGSSFTIPTSATSWSITTNTSGSATVGGVAMSGGFSLSGSGPLFTAIVVSATAGSVNVSYTLNNVVANNSNNY